MLSNKKGKLIEFAVVILFIATGIAMRLLPHPPNFAPIAAIALFGGVYLSRKIALVLPLAAMVISDIFIGPYDQRLMAFVYASFILCVILGFWVKNNKKWYTIFGAGILGSLLFFLITNFAVWAFSPWYEKNLQGLVKCYVMALPFFRNTLAGDLFYVSIIFGAYEITRVLIKEKFRLTQFNE